ncbi:MAG TPA: DUF5658 family protein [Candidatus Acidoferrales bacterium]|nr:DUF5658 family protein [Candidatus Acidoferrales bacterium]
MLMGTIDCITTTIGILYFGAVEMNPIMATIVNNVPLFMALKLSATFCIGGTCILANKILYSTADKTTKSFRYGSVGMKIIFTGLIAFMMVVVINNFMVLLA